MELANEISIFTSTIAVPPQMGARSRSILKLSPRLQQSIELRWQATIAANPDRHHPQDIAKLLVADLFDRLHREVVDPIVTEHWLAFLSDLALAVSDKIFVMISRDRYLNIYLQDVQSICINTIVDPQLFFANFNLSLTKSTDLLSSLKAYAYQSIRYAAYPSIRKEFGCPNIGRSNLSLFNQYSDLVITQSLSNISRDRQSIDRDLSLCRCTRAYLRQMVTRIDRLQPDDFHQIGELYQGITGDLPPPVAQRLEQIGAAIRRFTSPKVGSIDLPIGKDSDDKWTIIDAVVAPNPQPEEVIETKQVAADCKKILDICDRWLVENTTPRDRQIIYLRYHFQLKQAAIEPLVGLDQSNISIRLRQVHRGVARSLIEIVNPDGNIQLVELMKPIIETLQASFDRLKIFHTKYISNRVDTIVMDELIGSIQKYQQSSAERTNLVAIAKIRSILEQLCE